MWRWLIVVCALCLSADAPSNSDQTGWQLVVLGIAQDGGMPHPGCTKPPCTDVYAGTRTAEKVSSIGLVNRSSGAAYLIDATPDFPAQLHALTGGRVPDGIFLTHGHIGHYTGLMYLGKEAMATKDVPVYGTRRMISFLRKNAPWSALVHDRRIDVHVEQPDEAIALRDGLRITPILVPHRDELTDTVGYLIEGPRAKALFIPDIDKWEKWNRSLRDYANEVDVLLIDGTFSSMQELPGRDISQVPHPLMTETRSMLAGTRGQLWFIHLNHSNPALLDNTDVAREGMSFAL
jgi:pyrroloquinoline quinone biosynthesis protein B